MGIKLVKRKTEASTSVSEFQAILDSLAGLYSNGVQLKYGLTRWLGYLDYLLQMVT